MRFPATSISTSGISQLGTGHRSHLRVVALGASASWSSKISKAVSMAMGYPKWLVYFMEKSHENKEHGWIPGGYPP